MPLHPLTNFEIQINVLSKWRAAKFELSLSLMVFIQKVVNLK